MDSGFKVSSGSIKEEQEGICTPQRPGVPETHHVIVHCPVGTTVQMKDSTGLSLVLRDPPDACKTQSVL